MRRLWLVPIPLLFAVAVVWADDRATRAETERARKVQRDRELIEELVNLGLRLAEDEDALKRAGHCSGTAERFAREISAAAGNREGSRALEMSQHLKDLLQRGVAENLRTARELIPVGSAEEQTLNEVQHHTAEVVLPLEEELQQALKKDRSGDLRETLSAIQSGRSQVEKATRAREPARGP
jgi:hypothetical protein